MEFGRAFSFVFDDQDWIKKVAIAALVSLIPIVGPLLLAGWGLGVTRRVIRGDATPLPDFSDFGGTLVDGLKIFVIGFVYMLPIILVQSCSGGIIAIAGQQVNEDTLTTVIAVSQACFGCLTLLYSIFVGLMLPAAVGKFADTDELKAAFRFGEVFGLVRNNVGAYIIVLLGGLVAGLVASLGVIACVIGMFFTSAYSFAVNGHLMGQAYKQATTTPVIE
jgi:hypothetical protein